MHLEQVMLSDAVGLFTVSWSHHRAVATLVKFRIFVCLCLLIRSQVSVEALEEKTKAELAKLQSDTASPSSFVEEGAPDSFADLDAKLKAPSQLMRLERI